MAQSKAFVSVASSSSDALRLESWPSLPLSLPEAVTDHQLCALDANETADAWGLVAGLFRRGSWQVLSHEQLDTADSLTWSFAPEDEDATVVLWGMDPKALCWEILWTGDCGRSGMIRAPHDKHDLTKEFADGRHAVCAVGGSRIVASFGGIACIVVEGKRATQIEMPTPIQAITSFRYHSGTDRLVAADVQGFAAVIELERVTPQRQQHGASQALLCPGMYITAEDVRQHMASDAWSVKARHEVFTLELPVVLAKLQAQIDSQWSDYTIADTMWNNDGKLLHLLLVKKAQAAHPPHGVLCTWRISEESTSLGLWQPIRHVPLGCTIGDAVSYPFGAELAVGAGYFEGVVTACFDSSHALMMVRCNGGEVLTLSYCVGDGRLKDAVCPGIDAEVSYMKMNRWPDPHCNVRVILEAGDSLGLGFAYKSRSQRCYSLVSTPAVQFLPPDAEDLAKRFFVTSEGFLILAMAVNEGSTAPCIQACRCPGR